MIMAGHGVTSHEHLNLPGGTLRKFDKLLGGIPREGGRSLEFKVYMENQEEYPEVP